MCTAINSKREGQKNLFGRTLDVAASYGEGVVITPRSFCFKMKYEGTVAGAAAIIGTAVVRDDVPLYYDAANEYGLSIAALNFPTSAVYNEPREACFNVASFELIWWVLCKCRSVDEARELLLRTNVTYDGFDRELSPTPLHWMIADATKSIVAEPMADRLRLYDDPFDVLTNEPTFDCQAKNAEPFSDLEAHSLCRMRDIGFSGDLSSSSRFVRAFLFNRYCEPYPSEEFFAKEGRAPEVERFFHVASQVSVPYGSVIDENGKKPFTVYTSCIDTGDMTYYFTTYNDSAIRAVKLGEKEASAERLSVFSMGESMDTMLLN